MSEEKKLLGIVKTALGTFKHRQPYTPGMFESLKPLFRNLGYESAAVYIADDYPDRMHLEARYGEDAKYPDFILRRDRNTLNDELRSQLGKRPRLMTSSLFSHDRELGVLAVTAAQTPGKTAREAFDMLVQSMSVMAYIEYIRTNCCRERDERDLFFAQSLTSRLLIRDTPKVKGLRIGIEHTRSLEAAGDFFDFVATDDGRLLGFIGCCNGKGLRTVLEVCSIMRETHRSYALAESPAETLRMVNRLLVKEKRRAHQASICFFEIDSGRRHLRLAKAGKLDLLLCGSGAEVRNLSSVGGVFLGMMENPGIKDETFEFNPGQALLCVTEGFYAAGDCLGGKPQLYWFNRALDRALEMKRKKPLVNAILDYMNASADFPARPLDSLLALSVENTGRNGTTRVEGM